MKKILLVSLGSIGRRHLKNTRELLPDSDIAIFRQHHTSQTEVPEGANRVFTNLEDSLAFEPDAVIISSPAHDHIENATHFMKRGAHLFIEKPLSIDSTNLSDFISLSEKSSVFAMVGYVLRFQPMVYFLKNYLSDGEVGKVQVANIEVGQYLPDWRPGGDYRKGVSAQKKLGGGVLLELSHEIDYGTWFFGYPSQVFCSANKLSNLDIDVEDSANLIMEYDKSGNRKRVNIHLDFLQRTASMSVKVIGEEGTLYADLIKETAHVVFKDGVTKTIEVPKLKSGNEMYLRQFDFFFSRSFQDYESRFKEMSSYQGHSDLRDAAKVMKLVDLAKESNKKGMKLSFDEE